MSYILNTTAVIDNHDFEWGVISAVPAAEEVPTNPSKAIDCNFQLCNGLSLDENSSSGLKQFTTKVMSII